MKFLTQRNKFWPSEQGRNCTKDFTLVTKDLIVVDGGAHIGSFSPKAARSASAFKRSQIIIDLLIPGPTRMS